MPRNFSELKGGTIPMLSPTLKSGERVPPPVPHRSTPVLEPINNINTSLQTDRARQRRSPA